jgi:glycosyltransferase involved in cell wall biosynthesis
MVNHMRELLGSYGDRMIYLGEVPHARLYPLFSSASAVVLPSLVDNLPNSCLEAMASGSIVIGTDGASFEQVIEHASNGFLAAPNSVRSLARAMREALMLDETARARMKALAQRRIEELSPQRQVPRLVEFYERTITGVRDD